MGTREPDEELIFSNNQQREYVCTPQDVVDTRSLQAGDCVYIPTEYGSRYIMEVTEQDDSWLYVELSRRGEPREFNSGLVLTELEKVPTRIYHDHGIMIGHRLTIYSMDSKALSQPIRISTIAEGLQVVSREI